MKLLLDEQMHRKITKHFPSYCTLKTVQDEGWSGVKNGELLLLAKSRGFEALVSANKNLSYQQNPVELPISVVVLHVFRLRIEDLAPLIPRAIQELESIKTPAFVRVDV